MRVTLTEEEEEEEEGQHHSCKEVKRGLRRAGAPQGLRAGVGGFARDKWHYCGLGS